MGKTAGANSVRTAVAAARHSRRRRSNNSRSRVACPYGERGYGRRWQEAKRSTSRADGPLNIQPFVSAGAAGDKNNYKKRRKQNTDKQTDRQTERDNLAETKRFQHDEPHQHFGSLAPALHPPSFTFRFFFSFLSSLLIAFSTLCRMYACITRLPSPHLLVCSMYAARTPPNQDKFGDQLPRQLHPNPTSFDTSFQKQTSKSR